MGLDQDAKWLIFAHKLRPGEDFKIPGALFK